jgi:hypothetical protein
MYSAVELVVVVVTMIAIGEPGSKGRGRPRCRTHASTLGFWECDEWGCKFGSRGLREEIGNWLRQLLELSFSDLFPKQTFRNIVWVPLEVLYVHQMW